ncbi:MAG TPA: hypothetical protein PK741_10520 [Petrotogaceae bacterium]|jgi:hypothetical protein|nr:hypothetical protein [Petrotogaceae bacterium]
MFLYKVKLNLYIETSLEKNYFWFCNPEAGENGWIIEYDYSFKHPEEINDNEIKYLAYSGFFLRFYPVIDKITKVKHIVPPEIIEKKWEDPYFYNQKAGEY